MNEVGCFGKLPAHGDFIWQALPTEFVTPWDNWLQEELLALQESLGEDWLEHYLGGVMWRFVISDESLGQSSWGGVITPSVDMVGRYFPFTIAVELPAYVSVVTAPRLLTPWFEHLEECMLGALERAVPLEEIMQSARSMEVPEVGEREPEDPAIAQDLWSVTTFVEDAWPEQMMENIVYRQFRQPCHWSTVIPDGDQQHVRLSDGLAGFGGLFTRFMLAEPPAE